MLTRVSPDACPTRCLSVGLASPSTRPAPQRSLPHKEGGILVGPFAPILGGGLGLRQPSAETGTLPATRNSPCSELSATSSSLQSRPLCSRQRREPAALGRHLGTAPKSSSAAERRKRCHFMPSLKVGFAKMRGLAADGNCKTFDSSADGFARGEGMGRVLSRF